MSHNQPDPEATRLNPLSGEELEALRAAREQRTETSDMPQQAHGAPQPDAMPQDPQSMPQQSLGQQPTQQQPAPSQPEPRSDWNFEAPVTGWGEQGQTDVSGWGGHQDAAPSGWADPQQQTNVSGWANSTQSVENWDPAQLQAPQKSGKSLPIPMPWLIGGIAAVILLLLIIILIIVL